LSKQHLKIKGFRVSLQNQKRGKKELCKKILLMVSLPFCVLGLFFSSAYGEENYLTHPPKGWECINDPSQLPQKIKAIYIAKGKANQPFTPSLNVACEETSLSLNSYVQLAKSYHEGESQTRCTLLGKIATEAGRAELLQIDRPSKWGAIRFIQAMLIQDGEAYVVTATCLKEDFSALSSQIFKAMQSLTVPKKTLQLIE
jgi:hypothetical protein